MNLGEKIENLYGVICREIGGKDNKKVFNEYGEALKILLEESKDKMRIIENDVSLIEKHFFLSEFYYKNK